MHWLNYHHLLYFWKTARYGSITRACEELHLTPQTVSAQIRTLERAVGEDLFLRTGRRMELTDTGQLVYRYAEEIFNLGTELAEILRGHATTRPVTLQVGIYDALPKLVAHHVLEPVLGLEQRVRIVTVNGKPEPLLADLVTHKLDVVISDAPIPPGLKVKAYNHFLGDCSVTLMATPPLARSLRRRFPQSLNGAPLLLPTVETALRPAIDLWLNEHDLHPEIVGEFSDSAVKTVFGQKGTGAFLVPTVVEAEVRRQHKVHKVSEIPELKERFYAISVERKVRHPAVAAIFESARDMFRD